MIKTRLQLQGELLKKTKEFSSPYRGALSAFSVILRTEGLNGLQRGLLSAYLYQMVMNGVRFGAYGTFVSFTNNHPGRDKESLHLQHFLVNVFSGAAAGVMVCQWFHAFLTKSQLLFQLLFLKTQNQGAAVGSPFFLIKTRLQSYSPVFPTGTQHHFTSTGDGIRKIYSKEGWRGFFRGMGAAMLRTGIGSSIQLPAYDYSKKTLTLFAFESDNLLTHFFASMISGFMVCIGMNPFDVVSTRIYNQNFEQGQGQLYKNPLDCLKKTIAAEGVAGLYKGFWGKRNLVKSDL